MLRDFPWTIGLIFLGIILIVFTGFYYQSNYKQDSVVLGITETVRTSAIANVDNISRISKGELFIQKEKFEEDFKNRITKNNNINLSNNTVYEFEYLDNKNGSIKAIRVTLKDNDVDYQATAIVDISDEKKVMRKELIGD